MTPGRTPMRGMTLRTFRAGELFVGCMSGTGLLFAAGARVWQRVALRGVHSALYDRGYLLLHVTSMRLSVTKHVAANHSAAPWLVVVPRRLSSTGKRQFHYFATKAKAELFAASLRGMMRRHGERPVTLSADDSADARTASAILEGSGLSLVQAALLAVQLLKCAPSAGAACPDAAAATGQDAPPLSTRSRKLYTLASVFREMQAGKAHQSLHTQRSRVGRFNALFRRNAGLARTPINLLSARDIQRALDRAWPHAPTSWNTMLTHLSTLFNYAVRKGILGSNPLGAIDRRHVAEKEISPLSPPTLRALLRACRPPTSAELSLGDEVPRAVRQELVMDTSHLAPYIAIAAFAGIRPTEVTRLKWGDINLEDGCISVRRAASKTGGTRHVELHPTLRAWLEPLNPASHPPGALLFRAGAQLTRRLRAVRRRAGFDASNPWPEDVLRHSYASYYLKAGGGLERLQLNMGHSSTALIYARYCNMSGLTREMAAEWWGLTPRVVYGGGGGGGGGRGRGAGASRTI